MEKREKFDNQNEVHRQIIGWTENCDTKASIVIAAIGVLISETVTSDFLIGNVPSIIKNIIPYSSQGKCCCVLLSIVMLLSLIASLICIMRSFYYAIETVRARIDGPNNSIIFFGDIAKLSKDDYINKVTNLDDKSYEADKLTQIHTCAKICKEKFIHYNKSVGSLQGGLFFFVVFVISVVLLR